MNEHEPQPVSPRQRLQQLLAIAEGQRTEAQWDEINELEIKLASGNRQDAPQQGAPQQGARRHPPAHNNPGPGGHQRPRGGGQGKKPFRKFHKRQPNGGGGGGGGQHNNGGGAS